MSYSADARQLAINAYRNSDWSIETTAKNLGIAKATLQNWLDRDKQGESLEDRPRPGRPRNMSPAHTERLVELTQLHPDWTQQMFADALNQEFEELALTQPNISVELKALDISLKKKRSGQTRSPQNASSD